MFEKGSSASEDRDGKSLELELEDSGIGGEAPGESVTTPMYRAVQVSNGISEETK